MKMICLSTDKLTVE